MSTVAVTSPHSILRSGHATTARKTRNAVAHGLIIATVAIAMIPLVLILLFIIDKGAHVISVSFLTDDIPITDRTIGGGIGPAVVGTLLITGGAALMAIPLGVLGGIYLSEYGRASRLGAVIRFLADIMTGVPSIVMGLFIYTVWVLRFKEQTGFAGALALACLMLPIVIRTTEEMLKLVPSDLREGSYALGSRKLRTIRTVVLPHAAPGIMSGALLAVARAAGETAPLLFTIGIVTSTNTDLLHGSNTSLSREIFRNVTSPYPGAQDRGYGAAFTLIVLVFLFTALARVVTAMYARRTTAGA